jgi:YidC/Oxa1 family membrane protein insertase
LQPTIKDIQAKYQSNPEVMNQKIAEVYQTNQVNPLAGCLPSLVQIPIFIGLYRAVLDLAKEDQLNEPFLFLPSLEGPVYGAAQADGSNWLFNWVDGAPPLGWDDTGAFLILPVLLVISQFISMEIMTPKNSEQQGNFILKLLPLMIGWFSLNVPSALTLYWFTNNIVTTATSVLIRSMAPPPPVVAPAGGTATSPSSIFAPPPMREKPAGFSSIPSPGGDGIKTITTSSTIVDAEIVQSMEDASSESDASVS